MRVRLIVFFSLVSLSHMAASQMVVSDPGSYMYYVEEVSNGLEQINQGIEQIETLGGIKDGIENVYAKLSGTYNRASGLQRELDRTARRIHNIPQSVTNIRPRHHSNVEVFSSDWMKDARRNTGRYFADPRSDRRDRPGERSKRYEARQTALLSNLATANSMMDQIPDRLDNIEQLTAQIDSTENVKDAQDLTNRLLGELLLTSEMMLTMLAHMAEADAMMDFEGIDLALSEDSAEETKKQVRDGKKFIKTIRREAGITGMSTDQALRKLRREQQ